MIKRLDGTIEVCSVIVSKEGIDEGRFIEKDISFTYEVLRESNISGFQIVNQLILETLKQIREISKNKISEYEFLGIEYEDIKSSKMVTVHFYFCNKNYFHHKQEDFFEGKHNSWFYGLTTILSLLSLVEEISN